MPTATLSSYKKATMALPLLTFGSTGAGLATGLAAADTVGSESGSVVILAAILGSGLVTALIQLWVRKKTGQDKADVSESLSRGANEVAGAVNDLLHPMREENARLQRLIAEGQLSLANKTQELATAQVELVKVQAEFMTRRHRDAQDLATLAAKAAHQELLLVEQAEEIRTLKVRIGQEGERREHERRGLEDDN